MSFQRSNRTQYIRNLIRKPSIPIEEDDKGGRIEGSLNGRKRYTRSTENNKADDKGPYSKVHQEYFIPLNEKRVERSVAGEYIIDEEIMGIEVCPGEVYKFDLGIMRWIEELEKRNIKDDQNVKIQIVDNYYLYQFIYSVKDGIPAHYTEEEIEWSWNAEQGVYRRQIKRIYGEGDTDLDSYQDYHLIVRVLRFQIGREIFEIVVPRLKNSIVYSPPTRMIGLLLDRNFKLLDLPNGCQFMIRRCL